MIRIGVLGAARIAPRAIVEPAKLRTDVEVRSVAARDPLRAKEFAVKYEIPFVEKSYEALLSRDDLDLIYIPLPPASHAEWTIRALEQGKDVLCEKPFATSTKEAIRMVETAERCGRRLIEAFHYRFHPVMRRAIELVAENAFGRLTSVEAGFEAAVPYPDTLWNGALGCGALTDLGCYPIHALRTLVGEPTVLESSARWEHGTQAEFDARLRFPDDIPGRIFCKLIDGGPPGTRQCWLRLEGEQGRMEITNFVVPHLYTCTFSTTLRGVERQEPVSGPTTYAAQLDHVVEVLLKGAPQLTGGADAIATMKIIDEIRVASGSDIERSARIPAGQSATR
jgi:predicted dehydrogenase